MGLEIIMLSKISKKQETNCACSFLHVEMIKTSRSERSINDQRLRRTEEERAEEGCIMGFKTQSQIRNQFAAQHNGAAMAHNNVICYKKNWKGKAGRLQTEGKE